MAPAAGGGGGGGGRSAPAVALPVLSVLAFLLWSALVLLLEQQPLQQPLAPSVLVSPPAAPHGMVMKRPRPRAGTAAVAAAPVAGAGEDWLARREQVREMFHHALEGYMTYAFPHDELRPLSCDRRTHWQRERGRLDDVLGGFALTLVDGLDTLAVMGETDKFFLFVDVVLDHLNSSASVCGSSEAIYVSVFETNIRIVGGLVSAHLLAERLDVARERYQDGALLHWAQHYAERLLPAFDTPTGLPFHRINIQTGEVLADESRITCPAAAATFLLEFTALSRLTGDERFEAVARRASDALWYRRSKLDLLGAEIHVESGEWTQKHASVGAGVDSYLEYLLKSFVAFSDTESMERFLRLYTAAMRHTRWNEKYFVDVDMSTAAVVSHRISSLQAFLPSVQVLAGFVEQAEDDFDTLLELWSRFDALPDFYDVRRESLLGYGRDWSLRPEMIEAASTLYEATGDHKYLQFGLQTLSSIERVRTDCGFASVADVSTWRLDERMDSYLLAESLKYLYLLFDSALPLEQQRSIFCKHDDGQCHDDADTADGDSEEQDIMPPCVDPLRYIFSTEGHLILTDHANLTTTLADAALSAPSASQQVKRRRAQKTGQLVCQNSKRRNLPRRASTDEENL